LLAGWEVHRGAIDELLQGMEELDQLDLIVDHLLQGMEEPDQLTNWTSPSIRDGNGASSGRV
jgi:hypothetical protein